MDYEENKIHSCVELVIFLRVLHLKWVRSRKPSNCFLPYLWQL